MGPAGKPRLAAHHYAWISIAASLLTIGLKTFAWWVTGSVGLLSDAMESLVNLAGACFALWMLLIARTPADERHPWGHSKAEYFSTGFEGTLIFVAALAIAATAIPRLLHPIPLEQIGEGLVFSVLSTGVNFLTARTLARASQRLGAVALDADARHLMTDVWTTVGVIAGVLLVPLTGELWLDPLIALLVALHILKEGWLLMRDAVGGLMDEAMSSAEIHQVEAVLTSFSETRWQNLLTRRAGQRRFVQVELLVPPDWSVARAHQLADEVETAIALELPGAKVTTHIEPSPGLATLNAPDEAGGK
jgi:cation diffusion facilitator family transporter